MIGFFTDPYADELLYSACARYHRRARNRSKEATARDLFGNNRAKIVVDFPTRLDYLAAQLPPATYSVNRLIDEHTMLPLYSPFMPPERHATLRQDMRGEGGGSLHARLGILTSGIDVKQLRFCIVCVEDDREPYWHRIHQFPGVEVCSTHSVFLSL
jgi:TniQ